MSRGNEPSESQWAELRDAQRRSLVARNTAMVVAIDLGERNNVHPLNKKEVGERLALAARKMAYNEGKIVANGPLYKSMAINKGKIILTFSLSGSNLVSKGNKKLTCFAIAGRDVKFVWANAMIKDNKVIEWSEIVKNPTVARYAQSCGSEAVQLAGSSSVTI